MIIPTCPMCKRVAEQVYRPFCSRRCADLDLQKWLTGAYAIPAAQGEEDAGGTVVPEDPDED